MSTSSSLNKRKYYPDIWDLELDYVFVGSPHNYLKKIKLKQKTLASAIEYYKGLVNNPRYTKASRETIFLPTLRTYLRVQEKYRLQASVLGV